MHGIGSSLLLLNGTGGIIDKSRNAVLETVGDVKLNASIKKLNLSHLTNISHIRINTLLWIQL